MRLARRLRRDLVERGRDVDSVLEQVSLSFFLFYCLGFERVPSLLAALINVYEGSREHVFMSDSEDVMFVHFTVCKVREAGV